MSAKDFGYFLLFIGIAWLALIIPFDPTPFMEPLTLPIVLVLFGSFYILKSFIKSEALDKALGYTFLVFIILMVRANGFLIFTPWNLINAELTESYYNSIAIPNGSPVNLGCDSCSLRLISSVNDNVTASIKHSVNSNPEVIVNNGLSITLKHTIKGHISGGEVNYSIPSLTGNVNVKSGVGSIDINLNNADNPNYLNISTGVGSINLTSFDTIGFEDTIINTGVGSVSVSIDGLNGSKTLDINVGVGSIELFVKPGLVIQFSLNTGLGSVDNNYLSASNADFSNAANRLIITAHTGLGSVSVKTI